MNFSVISLLFLGTRAFLQQLALAQLAVEHEKQRVQLASYMEQLLASLTSQYPQISFAPSGQPSGPAVAADDGPQETYEPMEDVMQDDVYEDTDTGGPAAKEEIYEETDDTIQEDAYDDAGVIQPPRPPLPQRPSSGQSQPQPGQQQKSSPADLVSENGDEPISWDYDVSDVGKKKMRISELKSVRMKGTLEKLGGKGQNSWQKRVCVLSGSFLYFYEKDSSKTYNNRIVVPGYSVSVDNEKSNEKKKQFVFKLSSEGTKNYYFRATSEKDCQKWVAALSAVARMTMTAVGTYSTLNEASEDEKRDVMQNHPLPPVPPDGSMETYEPIDIHDFNSAGGGGGGSSDEEYTEPDSDVSVPPPKLPIPPQPRAPSPHSFPPPPRAPSPHSFPPQPRAPSPHGFHPAPPPIQVDTNTRYADGHNGLTLPNVYVAVFDFYPYEKDELQLQRGDLVHVLDRTSSPEWWYGEAVSPELMQQGRTGFFPANHLMEAFQVA